MFELSNVSKSFGSRPAVRSITLAIPGDRTTAIIGPSGCGKSTILRLLLGLIRPDSGEVRFNGEDIAATALDAYRQKIGYVVQGGGLFPHLSAGDNVTLMARHLGLEGSWIDKRLRYLTELVGLEAGHLERRIGALSGGERQRVALMRALMLDPDVLLLDEPLGALDSIVRHRLQGDLKNIFADLGKTVILVTHDLGEAAYLGRHIVLMADGRVEQEGSIDSLVNHPASEFTREFLASQRTLADVARSGS